MGKARSTYGVPLYGAAWPLGDYVIMCGGGGKPSSGIANKLTVAQTTRGVLSPEVALLKFDLNAPLRLALSPSGAELVVAMAGGGLLIVRISPGLDGPIPVLSLDQGPSAARLLKVGMVKCMAFSSDARCLAVGTDDGGLEVRDWPSGRPLMTLSTEDALKEPPRDVDFSMAHSNKVLAATCEDGSCSLWEWERGICITRLELPPDIKRGSFSRCRFARDGSLGLYAALNAAGEGYVLYYEQNDAGEMVCSRKARVDPNPITAFDISPAGSLLGFGTSEGDVAILSASSLRVMTRQRAAHLVFVTAVAFSPDSKAMLSVSGDASARVTLAGQERSELFQGFLVLLILLAIVVMFILLLRHIDSGAMVKTEL